MKLMALAGLAGAAVLMTGTADAQQGVDFSKVEVKISDLGNKTYRLEGAGRNVTVAVGGDGIIMVDAGSRSCTTSSRPRSRRCRTNP